MMNNDTLVAIQNFILPGTMDGGFSAEDLGDDFDGLQLSFRKLKIPGGGALQFELPGENPDNPEYEKFIDGIIIYNHAANAFWPAGSEYDENVSPLCSSYDGKTGSGLPGGACELCPMNAYGTDQNGGKGKACKNMRTLYILRSGEAMPIQFSLPPTSIRPFNDFANAAFVTRKRPTWASVVRIGLTRVANGTNTYSVANFQKLGDLNSEQLSQVKQYVETFREQVKEMQKLRAQETENRVEPDGRFDTEARYAETQDGEHYVITGAPTIDGDDDDLPL